jgi:hypothetical protein
MPPVRSPEVIQFKWADAHFDRTQPLLHMDSGMDEAQSGIACARKQGEGEQQQQDRPDINVLRNHKGTSTFSSTTRPSNK